MSAENSSVGRGTVYGKSIETVRDAFMQARKGLKNYLEGTPGRTVYAGSDGVICSSIEDAIDLRNNSR